MIAELMPGDPVKVGLAESTNRLAEPTPAGLVPRNTFLCGDVRARLRWLPDECVNSVVTSPPYWSLRDYGVEPTVWGGDPACVHMWQEESLLRRANDAKPGAKQATNAGSVRLDVPILHAFCCCGAWRGSLGLEPTPDLFVEHLVDVFREVRRVLRKDGTVWLVLGDSYASNPKGPGGDEKSTLSPSGVRAQRTAHRSGRKPPGYKPKDLIGLPWRVALALQADGWWLRSDIIWSKPNAMPESVTDRPTRSHEYVFLLSKSRRYYYDYEAVKEPLAPASIKRITQVNFAQQTGGEKDYSNGTNTARSARGALEHLELRYRSGSKARKFRKDHGGNQQLTNAHQGFGVPWEDDGRGRNKRTVWTVTPEPSPLKHYATFPTKLIEPCILAGAPAGGIVLDPFMGTGTTALVAVRNGRDFIGIDLNPEYVAMAEQRLVAQRKLL